MSAKREGGFSIDRGEWLLFLRKMEISSCWNSVWFWCFRRCLVGLIYPAGWTRIVQTRPAVLPFRAVSGHIYVGASRGSLKFWATKFRMARKILASERDFLRESIPHLISRFVCLSEDFVCWSSNHTSWGGGVSSLGLHEQI